MFSAAQSPTPTPSSSLMPPPLRIASSCPSRGSGTGGGGGGAGACLGSAARHFRPVKASGDVSPCGGCIGCSFSSRAPPAVPVPCSAAARAGGTGAAAAGAVGRRPSPLVLRAAQEAETVRPRSTRGLRHAWTGRGRKGGGEIDGEEDACVDAGCALDGEKRPHLRRPESQVTARGSMARLRWWIMRCAS